ncbi:hypothetical protein MF406_03955 [Georgenia sp. TF02-10]|uniref:hypothetical protein n=1 Tax=Georgenia sp. TF02-10 TaxID=2917725 RepID=UPI001FA71B6B|nr:hypothetical protein [Georgenia sp. TF02-10]UNX55429.1 hypothetical protein MF406_03955 [Georgenia sp. TF02-10]
MDAEVGELRRGRGTCHQHDAIRVEPTAVGQAHPAHAGVVDGEVDRGDARQDLGSARHRSQSPRRVTRLPDVRAAAVPDEGAIFNPGEGCIDLRTSSRRSPRAASTTGPARSGSTHRRTYKCRFVLLWSARTQGSDDREDGDDQ